jgi:hypothetical protein
LFVITEPWAASTAGEAKFSLAISSMVVRWRSSSPSSASWTAESTTSVYGPNILLPPLFGLGGALDVSWRGVGSLPQSPMFSLVLPTDA